ncbi:hypothetical protein KUTeg_014713 [Tegillarca granosa]|uniref:Ig-like domain-containing protein n=1 Tax=Tegillarca granosa TaxID=220873 RepID=A0ABQ9EUX0_TEGGR|nr:hypothetical protein KUTeg_014713 [Tegillarca granosa]
MRDPVAPASSLSIIPNSANQRRKYKNYKPIITLDATNITVQEGDNPRIQCSAVGNPTPTVKWYRGSSEQTSGTGTSATLVFSNIDRNQADTYQCKATATRKLNFQSSKSVSLVVYYPPSVTVALQNTTENATSVVFTCNVADGFPTNYTYRGWNQYIGNTLVRSFTDFTGMLSDSNRKLTIPKVTFKDTGTYHCVVENGFHGRQTDVLQQGFSYFDARDPPEAPKKFTVRQNKTNSVILVWVRGFNGGDPQTFVIRYTDTDTVYESSKYDTTSAAVGGAIGSILTLIVIVVIIAVFILYRRRTKRGKSNQLNTK